MADWGGAGLHRLAYPRDSQGPRPFHPTWLHVVSTNRSSRFLVRVLPTSNHHQYFVLCCVGKHKENMASFLRARQAGVQNDFSAGITPGSFNPDEQSRYGINSQIRYVYVYFNVYFSIYFYVSIHVLLPHYLLVRFPIFCYLSLAPPSVSNQRPVR
jgi:hypothetical protein